MKPCGGWKGPCGLPVRYHVKWSWDGARMYPSEHDLCGPCAELCEQWLVRAEREYLTDSHYEWWPITESAPDTRDRSTQDANRPPQS